MGESSFDVKNVHSQAPSRRAFLALGGGSVLVLVAACSTGTTGGGGTASSGTAADTLTFAIPVTPAAGTRTSSGSTRSR